MSKHSRTHTIPTDPSDNESSEMKLPPYMPEAESPAPPPPSPEHHALPTEHLDGISKSFPQGFTGDALSALPTDDKDESSSQYTISAKPPSNLDDCSRINTPNSLAPPSTPSRTLLSRDSTRVTMDPVTEENSARIAHVEQSALIENKHHEKIGVKLVTMADGTLTLEGLNHRDRMHSEEVEHGRGEP